MFAIESMAVTAVVAALAAAVVTSLIFVRLRRPRNSKVSVYGSLERIREVGDLTVLTAYVKEVVTMTSELESMLSSTGKILLICGFDIEFRYDLRKIQIDPHTGSAHPSITLPPHFVKVVPQQVQFYDERKSAVLGIFPVDFKVEERNRLLKAAKDKAIEQASVLETDLQMRVRASAIATLRSLAAAFGAPDVEFTFADGQSVVRQVTDQLQAA
jgi:hypothetical protein